MINENTVCVTGGTGLLGSRLIYDLLLRDYHVRALKRKTSSTKTIELLFKIWGASPKLFSKIEWKDGDVLDKNSIVDAIYGAKYFYHCAAMVSFAPNEKARMMEINVRGTANVVDAIIKSDIKKTCFASSVAALGRGNTQKKEYLIDESYDWLPLEWNSAYSESKHLAEKEIWRGIREGLKAVIVNPSIILGIGNPEKSSAKIFSIANKGNPFFTDGWSGFVDVRDVSIAMIKLIEAPIESERFIISEGNHSYRELFELLAKYLGKRPPLIRLSPAILSIAWRIEKLRSFLFRCEPLITRETARTASCKHIYNNEKIRNALDFKFIPFEKSIEENSEFFKQFQKMSQV